MGAERDAELTSGLATDVAGGFEAMVRAYQHKLYAFALAMSGEPADAEEVAQDTFVRAHAALRRYPPERVRALKLNAWLHQIALNVVRNRVRRRRFRIVPIDAELPVADAAPGPEAQALSRAALRELANLVSGLPEQQRSAVVLRCVQGMTYAEVAARLEQPEGTVKSNVHRGLQALRRRAGSLSEVS
jgi:RNA polymerase sigma-70 factor, ECF subfamily